MIPWMVNKYIRTVENVRRLRRKLFKHKGDLAHCLHIINRRWRRQQRSSFWRWAYSEFNRTRALELQAAEKRMTPNEFIRHRLYQEGLKRKILPPQQLSDDDLKEQLT